MKSTRKTISNRLAHQVRNECDSACANPRCREWNTSTHELHHIDGDRSNSTLENLVLLCSNCHSKEQAGIIKREEIETWKSQAKLGRLPWPLSPMPPSEELLSRKHTVIQNGQVNVNAGGDGHNRKIVVNVKTTTPKRPAKSKYPSNSIGADANRVNYIDYLFDLALKYWDGVKTMPPGRLGKKIKTKFKLGRKTRNHISVERFDELVDFIIDELLKPSPAGKRHISNETKLCRTFEEHRFGIL